jgi:hypothetical protein
LFLLFVPLHCLQQTDAFLASVKGTPLQFR